MHTVKVVERAWLFVIIFLMLCADKASGKDNTCMNGICDPNENYFSCPQDCTSGSRDNYCDAAKDNICDPDCAGADIDCKASSYSTEKRINLGTASKAIILAFSLFGLSIILYFLYKRTNKSQRVFDLSNVSKFTNIKKEKTDSWKNLSERQILEQIEKTNDFKQYKDE